MTQPAHRWRTESPGGTSPAMRGPSGGSDPGASYEDLDPLTPAQFRRITDLLYNICGIEMKEGKEPLVKARLWKRVKNLGLRGFKEYIDLVQGPSGQDELLQMVDVLTTNKTSFFREAQHFDLLRECLRSEFRGKKRLRFWCAGCSTGQEPYTMAITLLKDMAENSRNDVRILATDISSRVLETAKAGVYEMESFEGVDQSVLRRHFTPHTEGGMKKYRVTDQVRSMISFARLNLMEGWPMKGPFDIIFCRNVMIYFDKETQERLVGRFRDILVPGGYLFVGHSESLTGRVEGFSYVQPAVYRR